MNKDKINKIIEIVSKITNINEKLFNKESCMNDFPKWDSLAQVRIMMQLEKEYKKKINTSKMSDLISISKILKFLDNSK
jgi:acyl carrier protein